MERIGNQLDTLIGTSIGGYTLTRLLGAGGMGSVYLANDPAIGQQVAVKIIRTDLSDFTDSATAQMALDRFRQEARAVASLDHLHILQLYRYGEEPTPSGSRAYMIMQYRPEGSLADWLRRRADLAITGKAQSAPAEFSQSLPLNWPLSLDETNTYLQQAASALQYAHDRGIVHRDVKPANFLLRIDPQNRTVYLLLSDFGLAKVFTASSATSTILGTPTYMAPEQFDGATRPESDQYALAVMIYYLLSGHPPFGGDALQLMRQHLTSNVPAITSFHPAIAPALNGILARALAKQPEQRFPSVMAFAEAFNQILKGGPSAQFLSTPTQVAPQAFANSPQPYYPSPATPVSPLVLPPAANPTPAFANMAPGITPSAGLNQQAAGWTNTQVPPPQSSPGPLPGSQKVNRRGALGWIVGGTAIGVAGAGIGVYFFLQSRLPQNAIAVLAGHTNIVTSLSWQNGGSKLASGSLDQTVRLWSASGGSALQILQRLSPVRSVSWSVDGNLLAAGADDSNLALWEADGSSTQKLSHWGASIRALAWLRNDYVFLGTYGLGLHAFDLQNTKHYGKDDLIRVNSISLSPDGSLLVVALEDGDIYFADIAQNWQSIYNFNASLGAALAVAWSPDGNYVAVGYANNTAIVYNASSKQAQYTLKHNGAVYGLAWNPVSSTPMLASGAGDNTVNIWNLGAGTQSQTIYHGHSQAVLALAWSKTILASASQDKTIILWQPPT
jgi:serine/threonine protein kinase